jgi:hypothetical protein
MGRERAGEYVPHLFSIEDCFVNGFGRTDKNG